MSTKFSEELDKAIEEATKTLVETPRSFIFVKTKLTEIANLAYLTAVDSVSNNIAQLSESLKGAGRKKLAKEISKNT